MTIQLPIMIDSQWAGDPGNAFKEISIRRRSRGKWMRWYCATCRAAMGGACWTTAIRRLVWTTSRSGVWTPACTSSNQMCPLISWQKCGAGINHSFHDANGRPLINTAKFPSMKSLCDYGHTRGVKLGWYLNKSVLPSFGLLFCRQDPHSPLLAVSVRST